MPAIFSSPFLDAAAAAGLAAALAAWGMFRVRGSTAVPAAAWAVAACLALAAEMHARATGRLADPAAAAAARLAVVSLSLCPTMSLLGAKRPQHGVWQFIVATLAFVLFLPAISARLARPGSLPDLHLIERVFMPALVLLGWLNFAATRRSVAAGCIAVGQFLLLRGFLPGMSPEATASAALDRSAAVLIAAGAAIAAMQALVPIRTRSATGPLATIVDPVFLAVRETLGAAWALRLAESFDGVATARGWPCRLRFGGIEGEGTDEAAWHHDAARAFRSLARRFADDDWLARHGWPPAAGDDPRRPVHASP